MQTAKWREKWAKRKKAVTPLNSIPLGAVWLDFETQWVFLKYFVSESYISFNWTFESYLEGKINRAL